MRMRRRQFLESTGLGLTTLVAACSQQSSSQPRGQGQQNAVTPVTIGIVGGLAIVMKGGKKLVIGTVAAHGIDGTCDYPQHGMELRLIKGDYTDDTDVPSSAKSKEYVRRWIIDGERPHISGLAADPLVLPPNTPQQKPALPGNTAGAWNDCQYNYQPLTYHAGARLHPDWESPRLMPSAVTLLGGTLEMSTPTHPCILGGKWNGYDTKRNLAFSKPLNSMAVLKASTTEAAITLSFKSGDLILRPMNGGLEIVLYAATPFSELKFVKDEKAMHMGMFYGLCVGADGKTIPCDERFVPELEEKCPGDKAAFSPGSGCPDGVYVEA